MTHEFPLIREQHSNQPSVDDQVAVAKVLDEEGITSQESALKEDEISDLLTAHGITLEYTLRTSLDNLCAIPVLTRFFPPGSEYVLVSERRDEVVFGEVEETLQVDQSALLDHIQHDDSRASGANDGESHVTTDGRGATVRDVIATDAGIAPDAVEHYLQSGDLYTQRQRLNTAIDAIKGAEDVTKRDSYGKIEFRHKAYRYYLS